MKKTIFILLVFIAWLCSCNSVFSTETTRKEKTVIVTEKVPWVKCEEYKDGSNKTGSWVQNRKYECTVGEGFTAFQWIMAEIIRWFVFVVMLIWVLAIVGLGIAWTWAGGDDAKTKTNLKKWAINIAIGLAILFFFRYILTLIAPWIYQ